MASTQQKNMPFLKSHKLVAHQVFSCIACTYFFSIYIYIFLHVSVL